MNGDNAECSDILELTMSALNSNTLKWLLATVQEVNIRLQIKEMLMRYALYQDLDAFMFV